MATRCAGCYNPAVSRENAGNPPFFSPIAFMIYQIEHHEWDSTFLGYPVGAVRLSGGYDEAKLQATLREAQRHLRLVFVYLEARGPERLPSPDAPCVCYDRKVVFKKAIPSSPTPVNPHIKAYTSPICTRQMESLAIKSGRHSRFQKDPELSPQYERLFLPEIILRHRSVGD